jgi:hypothetical protein
MRLRDSQLDDLHQLALFEWRDSPGMVRRLHRRYREHVRYLVRVIRRAGQRKRRP